MIVASYHVGRTVRILAEAKEILSFFYEAEHKG
jgi:hypothetical protein